MPGSIKHSDWLHIVKVKKAAVLIVGLMIGAGLFWFYHQHRAQALFLTVTSTTTAIPNGDLTTGWTVLGGTSDGTCGTGGGTTHHCDRIDEVTSTSSIIASSTDYVSTGTSGTTGEIEKYDMSSISIPAGGWVSNITLYMYAESAACNGNAPNCDTVSMNILVGGTAQTASSKTMVAATYTWFNTSFNAPSGGWSQSLLDGFQAQFTRTRVGGGNSNNADDDVRIAAVYAVITYQYYSNPMISQTGYTFENDDGANVNSDSVQAGSSFTSGQTISSVQQGERMTLRVQLKNTGNGPMDYSNLGLFYDHGDGVWTRVRRANAPITGSGSGCSNSSWTCTHVETGTVDDYDYTSEAIDPAGNPWLSYYDGTNTNLKVAHYVGSGGTGCAGTSAWMCVTVDGTSTSVGTFTSIAIGTDGSPWVSYYDSTNGDLKVAHFVGSGGSGCAITSWTCTTVDSINTYNDFTSIAIDPSGNPWISYADTSNGDLKVAHYIGSGGSTCSISTTAWDCTAVDTANTVGSYSSITFDSSGNPWVSYYDSTNADLRAAHLVGSGGTGCAVTNWTCVTVDNSGTNTGQDTSIATDPSGNPWISYYDTGTLKVARYVGSGGTGCAVTTWTCTAVDTVSYETSIAFDPSGNPWISYGNPSGYLQLARYVGSGGTGCASSSAWTCTTVDNTGGGTGRYSSIAFDPSGNPWISYFNLNLPKYMSVATLSRAGEITMSSGLAGTNGDSITSSHADMTSAGDSTDKSDADCIGGGTWNNGKWFTGAEGAVSVPAGNSTAQCTEVAFTIDTSQAVAGTTYRFMVASKDNWRLDKGLWRGPISISAYPQMTITSSTAMRASKATQPIFAACTDANWGCGSIVAMGSSNTAMAIDSSGTPWLAYYSAGIWIAKYVGSGGTGCTSTAWTCTSVLGNPDDPGQGLSMAIGSDGNPWLSFVDATGTILYAAHYVGSGGTGCTSTAWTCTMIDASAGQTSIAIDASGNPWISYPIGGTSNLGIARYVGSGGNCSSSTAWKCTTIDAGGTYNAIAIDNKGIPWVSYTGAVGTGLWVAHYVGTGGTGCGSTSNWTCAQLDNSSSSIGQYNSIAIDSLNNPWISYYDTTNLALRVAHYVSSGGTGCTPASWSCTTVDSSATNGSGLYSSIAFDSSGAPWVSYQRSLNLYVGRYVGSGGTGCANSSAWTCTGVSTGASTPQYTSLAFDYSGSPWVSYLNNTSATAYVAKLNLPLNPLSATSLYTYPGRNAPRGDGRWHLDNGYAPRATSGSCTATVDALGYCGISANDNTFDSISGTNARLIYGFAYQNNNPSSIPTVTWYGRSNVAPSTAGTTGDIVLQAYNFSTKTWDTLATNSSSSDCNTADCSFSLQANKAGEQRYYENISNNFWIYFRVWQYENSSSETFKTDYFNITFENTGSRLNLGKRFINGTKSSYEL